MLHDVEPFRVFARTGERDRAPQYRFHGSTPPKAGHRDPIRAEVTAKDDGAGTATIRLYDPIDSWGDIWGVSAQEFVAALDAIPDVQEIQLRINCHGGEVYEAIAIMNALRNHPANVVATVDGLAASAASFIACAADETVMGRNTQLMIHDAWGICVGAAVDMTQMATMLNQISSNIASVYSDKAGGTVDDWRQAMLAETWYNADEAVSAGLADRVEAPPEDNTAENAFDLSAFKHPGRSKAPAPAMPAAASTIPPPPANIEAQRRRFAETRHSLAAARHGLTR